MKDLPYLHIVGPKKSGKTVLMEFLITNLTARGYRIGSMKHSSHNHPLDKIGSDSNRFYLAGANPSVFLTPEGMAAFYQPGPNLTIEDLLSRTFSDCDLVLIESFRQAKGPKILLLKTEDDTKGLENLVAVVNQEGYHPKYPAFKLLDVKLIDFAMQFMKRR